MYIKFLGRYEDNGIMRILFLKGMNFVSWGFCVIENNKPTVMSSTDLSKIHLNKVFSLLNVFFNKALF